MKTPQQLFFLAIGGLLLAGMTACSGSDDDNATADDSGARPRLLTITQTGAGTRATLTDNDGDALAASWKTGDKMSYRNITQLGEPFNSDYYGELTALSSAVTSSFSGTVTCAKDDDIAVVYPRKDADFNGMNKRQVTIDLAGQNGTLTKLANDYHYVCGVAKVTAITENTATAYMAEMKSLLSVCKFSFVDKSNSTPITVKSLDIQYYESEALKNYPLRGTLTANVSQNNVHAVASTSDTGTLAVATPEGGLETVYVALWPTFTGDNDFKLYTATFHFTVTDINNNTYTGKASAKLGEGEYVVATGLKLTKQQ